MHEFLIAYAIGAWVIFLIDALRFPRNLRMATVILESYYEQNGTPQFKTHAPYLALFIVGGLLVANVALWPLRVYRMIRTRNLGGPALTQIDKAKPCVCACCGRKDYILVGRRQKGQPAYTLEGLCDYAEEMPPGWTTSSPLDLTPGPRSSYCPSCSTGCVRSSAEHQANDGS